MDHCNEKEIYVVCRALSLSKKKKYIYFFLEGTVTNPAI